MPDGSIMLTELQLTDVGDAMRHVLVEIMGQAEGDIAVAVAEVGTRLMEIQYTRVLEKYEALQEQWKESYLDAN